MGRHPKNTAKYPRQKLTPKQQKFVDKFVETANATQSAAETYNCSSLKVAGSIGHDLLQKPEINLRIRQICDRRGLTEDWAARVLKKAGNAYRPVVVDKQLIDYPDHPTRINAATTALKLHGHLSTGVDARQDNRQINIAISGPDDLQRLEDISSVLGKLSDQQSQLSNQQTGEITDIEDYRVE